MGGRGRFKDLPSLSLIAVIILQKELFEKELLNSFIVSDALDYSLKNKIHLWLFGFLYLESNFHTL